MHRGAPREYSNLVVYFKLTRSVTGTAVCVGFSEVILHGGHRSFSWSRKAGNGFLQFDADGSVVYAMARTRVLADSELLVVLASHSRLPHLHT